MTSLELLACLMLISISAFMSGSEIALFSLSRFQLRSLKDRFRTSHRKIKRLLSDPGGLLVTILVFNEVVNVSLSAIVAEVVARYPKELPGTFSHIPLWALDTFIGLLITTPIVLFMCEITPKIIGAKANQLIATLTSTPLTIIYDLSKPIRLGLKRLVYVISKRNKGTARERRAGEILEHRGKILKEADFLLMIEEGHREGAIHEGELELIQNVFEFDDRTVSEVLTPLSQVHTLSEDITVKQAVQAMRSHKYSRIPISRGTSKAIVGILYSKDLLRGRLDPSLSNLSVSALMRKPLTVLPTLHLNALFRKFKQLKTHMAVVQGKDGTPLGIVTMSDVLDALFEDIFPDDETEDFVETRANI